jgi:hypothetical protein
MVCLHVYQLINMTLIGVKIPGRLMNMQWIIGLDIQYETITSGISRL